MPGECFGGFTRQYQVLTLFHKIPGMDEGISLAIFTNLGIGPGVKPYLTK
jgi:hypothetical protein